MTEDEQMTRSEHIAWCKKRARMYIDRGDRVNAYASFASDMTKHLETRGHPALLLGTQLMLVGDLRTCESMWRFIEGFN